MSNYTPPRSQDSNHFIASSPLTMAHYANSDNGNYNYTPSSHYENISSTYSTYPASFLPNQNQETAYQSENLQMASQYPYDTSILGNATSHQRPLAQTTSYPLQQISQHCHPQSPRYPNTNDPYPAPDVESQESVNEHTMLSEPVMPPLDGFPDINDFDRLIHR